jgi:DNA repair exonuclease SbcCD ATPase subunit
MPFEVEDYLELIRLLQERPEWRAELRRLLLTEELLGLPGLVRELVEAQRRTEERVGGVEERVGRIEEYIAALADAQRRTEERVGRVEEQIAALAEAQRRTEERVGRVEEQIAALAEAQRRTEERVGRVEEQIAALAEAQRRTEERVGRVEERVSQLEERVGRIEGYIAALAEAQHRTEERVSRIEENVAALAEAQRQTQENVAALAEAQRQTQEQVQKLASTLSLLAEQVRSLVEAQKHTDDTVGSLKGRMLELTYQNKAAAYFGPLLRRPRVVDLGALLETLEAHLSPEEFRDVLQLDLLVSGKPRLPSEAPEVFLAVEISSVIDERDIERALRRSALLRRAGFRVIPVVAGERATLGAEDEARTHHVVMLQDGRTFLWTEALHTWGAL